MWRIVFSAVSALALVETFAGTVAADSHPATGTTGGGGTQPVTTVPTTGIGLMPDSALTVLIFGLLAVGAVFAVVAMVSARRQQV
jgi:hypothetical protein